jgi:hypothetical protein
MWNRSTCYKHTNARTRRAARGGGKIARNTGSKKRNVILERGRILADLRTITMDMNKDINNTFEYLLRSKRFFNALITAIHTRKDDLRKDLLFIASSVSIRVAKLFKEKNKLKTNVNALIELFKKAGINDKKVADIDYTKLMDEGKANSNPVEYLHNLNIEIKKMNKLYMDSFDNVEESMQISVIMLDLAETIQDAINEIIAGLEPKNNTGLANLFKKAL